MTNGKKNCKNAWARRLSMLCVLLLSVVPLSGCAPDPEPDESDSFVSQGSETRGETETVRDAPLFRPRTGAGVYDVIYNAILDQSDACDLSSFGLSETEFEEQYDVWRLLRENPAIEYLVNYRWHSENGTITKVDLEYKNIPSDYRTLLDQAVQAAVENIKEHLQDSFTQAELVCAINDYIVTHCQYAYRADGVTPDNENANNAYSALVESRAVCDGYASAFTLLAQHFDLEVVEVSGTVAPGNENHAWNLVTVDGEWYHVDVTWNDPTPDKPGFAGHEYLLLSDAAMAGYRGSSEQYHAAWDSDAPEAVTATYEDAFWRYEDKPISFKAQRFEELAEALEQTSFSDVVIEAVKNDTEANVARFGYDQDEIAEKMKFLYPYLGYTCTIDQKGIVVKISDWKR